MEHAAARREAIPTGTVTFLFSDIEGSTRRWESVPDAMRDAVRRHDVILRDAIESSGGYVFKTVGDEFCSAFHNVHDAIGAALAAQREIAREDWSAIGGLRVRMAIHSGITDERDGDYFGRPVNRVARLLAIAHGAQMIISGVAFELAQATLPPDTLLRDMGRHRLKDLAEPERVYQVIAPDLPEIFPPLRSLAALANNLPQNVTTFLGRDDDLAEVKSLLEDSRLLTLLGAGGIGKTRLALQAGADLLDRFEGGVWFVELAPLTDPSLIPMTIANALSLEAGNRPVIDMLVDHLRNASTLIILDNCEHLIRAAAEVAGTLIRGCKQLKILATSREVLAIPGETPFRMPSLSVPPAIPVPTAAEAQKHGAVALFVDRAQAHVRTFVLSDENAPIVAEICRRLDGIALAIELAAPRLRALSISQLAERLNERFRLLTGGSRTALPRQQTMRALIDWSYDLLAENEKVVFRRIAIFAGGWTLDAATAVCSDEQLESWDVIDLLSVLVDKSLVVFETVSEHPRYRMLESTRQYALEKLLELGERETIARKHAEHVLAFARSADETWASTTVDAWVAPMRHELDNFRTALEWSLDAGNDPVLAFELVGALDVFWWEAQGVEGRNWIAKARALFDVIDDHRLIAKYWLAAANVALALRQQKNALEAARRAVDAFTEVGDVTGLALANRCYGSALNNLGRTEEGEPLIVGALETFRAVDNRRMVGLALRNLGVVRYLKGDLHSAQTYYEEALDVAQSLHDERGASIVTANLAELEFGLGNVEKAIDYVFEAIEYITNRSDWVNLCNVLINVSAYLLAVDRFDEARGTARRAVELSLEIGGDLQFAIAVQHLALISAASGGAERAALLVGFADAAYEAAGSIREPTEAKEYDRIGELVGAVLPARVIEEARTRGAALDKDRAAKEALLV